jgi:hypothetical protein
MKSERSILASRINGAKSRGPVTSAGKLKSSRNALRHGMLSHVLLIEGESQKNFMSLFNEIHDEFQPCTGVETTLVEDMAINRWRQTRLLNLESAGISSQIRRQAEMGQGEQLSPAACAAEAVRTLTDQSRMLEFLSRHETRCARQYDRSLRRLIELRAQKNANCRNEPEQPPQTTETTSASPEPNPVGQVGNLRPIGNRPGGPPVAL